MFVELQGTSDRITTLGELGEAILRYEDAKGPTPTRRQLRRRRNKGQLLRLPGQRDSVVLEERSIHVG